MLIYRSAAADSASTAFRSGCSVALTAADAAFFGKEYGRPLIVRAEVPEDGLTFRDESTSVREDGTIATLRTATLPEGEGYEAIRSALEAAVEVNADGEEAPGAALTLALEVGRRWAAGDGGWKLVHASPGGFRLWRPGQVDDVQINPDGSWFADKVEDTTTEDDEMYAACAAL